MRAGRSTLRLGGCHGDRSRSKVGLHSRKCAVCFQFICELQVGVLSLDVSLRWLPRVWLRGIWKDWGGGTSHIVPLYVSVATIAFRSGWLNGFGLGDHIQEPISIIFKSLKNKGNTFMFPLNFMSPPPISPSLMSLPPMTPPHMSPLHVPSPYESSPMSPPLCPLPLTTWTQSLQ